MSKIPSLKGVEVPKLSDGHTKGRLPVDDAPNAGDRWGHHLAARRSRDGLEAKPI